MQAYHKASIIKMDGKICDKVVSNLIEPGSNYSYVNPNLVDKFCFNKEVVVVDTTPAKCFGHIQNFSYSTTCPKLLRF